MRTIGNERGGILWTGADLGPHRSPLITLEYVHTKNGKIFFGDLGHMTMVIWQSGCFGKARQNNTMNIGL
jgi:hypothetical protein